MFSKISAVLKVVVDNLKGLPWRLGRAWDRIGVELVFGGNPGSAATEKPKVLVEHYDWAGLDFPEPINDTATN